MKMTAMRVFLSVLFLALCLQISAQTHKVWLDADTGNQTDDVYAIARLLADPSVEVVGLSSAHFNNADLALVESYLHPEMSKIKQVITPPENTSRKVKIFSEIDAKAMTADFWKSMNSSFAKKL